MKLALGPLIKAVVERWIDWTINRRTHRQQGIPSGLPYLMGYGTYFENKA